MADLPVSEELAKKAGIDVKGHLEKNQTVLKSIRTRTRGYAHDPMTNWSEGSKEGTPDLEEVNPTENFQGAKGVPIGIGLGDFRNNEYGLEFFRKIFNLEGLRGQRAAIVIRLFYEEERQKAEKRKQATQFGSTDVENFPPPSVSGKTREILGRKAGMTGRNISYLLAVYRNRPDLFELVFDGTYTINKAYTPAHAREASPT